MARVERELGPIDVLVNNAGYGHEGVLEESPLQEMRDQFEVNVFGAVAMIKAVLPAMRRRRRGHIVNITSMGGTITMPGIAYYCGSKFALEGISDTLSKELEPFGIAFTAVAPGSFRTDWAGRSMVRSARDRRLRRQLRAGAPGAPGKARRAAGRRRRMGDRDPFDRRLNRPRRWRHPIPAPRTMRASCTARPASRRRRRTDAA